MKKLVFALMAAMVMSFASMSRNLWRLLQENPKTR